MQDLGGRKKINARVSEELSSIKGIKLLCIKPPAIECRKMLVDQDRIYFDFPLLRVWIEYEIKGKIFTATRIVYPGNVYPYGRKTLGVIEEIGKARYTRCLSWYRMEDVFYEKYGFSLYNIKATLGRMKLAFGRLLSIGVVCGQSIPNWLFIIF